MVKKWGLYFSRDAQKDSLKLKSAGLKKKAQELLEVISVNSFQNPPPYERLKGDLEGAFSRRINIQHRLVYSVEKKGRIVRVLRMWTHYE